MRHELKGIIAGFVATALISAIFLLLDTAEILMDLDIVTLIDRLGSVGRGAAWVDHFIVGALLWGPVFAGIDGMTEERPRWQKGLVFGAGAWVMMMLIFMPVVGAGLFGWQLGPQEAIGMLIMHLIYGAVLGLVFGTLDHLFPTKPLVSA
jgi:hypothetical protein